MTRLNIVVYQANKPIFLANPELLTSNNLGAPTPRLPITVSATPKSRTKEDGFFHVTSF